MSARPIWGSAPGPWATPPGRSSTTAIDVRYYFGVGHDLLGRRMRDVGLIRGRSGVVLAARKTAIVAIRAQEGTGQDPCPQLASNVWAGTVAAGTVLHMSDAETLTLREPADVVGAIPWFLGFHPQESLVLICLGGPNQRMRMCARCDLSDLEHPEAVTSLVCNVQRAGGDAVLLVCYPRAEQITAAAGTPRLPEQHCVTALHDAFITEGIGIGLRLAVVDGRWYSYDQVESRYPPEGTPIDRAPSGVTAQLAASVVGSGGTVLRSRSELRSMIAPPVGLRARVLSGLGNQLTEDMAQRIRTHGWWAARAHTDTRFQRAWRRWRAGQHELTDTEAMELVIGLQDVHARDEAIRTDPGADGAALLVLWSHLARCADDETAAPVCSALACVACMEGDGALVNIALERALRADPHYSLAHLLLQATAKAVPPQRLREVWRAPDTATNQFGPAQAR